MHETHPYRRLLALINFDGSDEKIARKALLLARMNRAQLTFLHLIEPDAALDGGYPAASAKAHAEALESGALRRLDFMVAQFGAGEAECVARCGPTRQTLNQILQGWQPDLLIAATELSVQTGFCDVLILAQDTRAKGGKLISRLTGWLANSFQPAAP